MSHKVKGKVTPKTVRSRVKSLPAAYWRKVLSNITQSDKAMVKRIVEGRIVDRVLGRSPSRPLRKKK